MPFKVCSRTYIQLESNMLEHLVLKSSWFVCNGENTAESKFSVIFIHWIKRIQVLWTGWMFSLSLFLFLVAIKLKAIVSKHQPNFNLNRTAVQHEIAVTNWQQRRQNYLTVIRSRKWKQLHLILISLLCMHLFCQAIRHVIRKFNHEKQSIRMGIYNLHYTFLIVTCRSTFPIQWHTTIPITEHNSVLTLCRTHANLLVSVV